MEPVEYSKNAENLFFNMIKVSIESKLVNQPFPLLLPGIWLGTTSSSTENTKHVCVKDICKRNEGKTNERKSPRMW